jgi:hypothetical protein
LKDKFKEVDLLLKLLMQNTSIKIVQGYLKDKGLHHSAGTWDDLVKKRIMPSVDRGELSRNDLERLLSQTEEFGKQHTFLYKCSEERAKEVIDPKNIATIAKHNNLEGLLVNPLHLESADVETMTDIRFETLDTSSVLILKVIKTRWHTEFLRESEEDNIIRKEWRKVPERAVNVVRLHSTGLLELRIASQSNSSTYEQELLNLWEAILIFIPKDLFREISLYRLKQNLINNSLKYKSEIRYSTTKLVNDAGYSIQAAAGSMQNDLSDNKGTKESMDTFLANNGYCDNSNIWLIKDSAPNILSTDIHILISGLTHEFAVTRNCAKNDYDYVLKKLLLLNVSE